MNRNDEVRESLKYNSENYTQNQSFIIKTLLNSNLQKRLMARKTEVQIIIQICLHCIKGLPSTHKIAMAIKKAYVDPSILKIN